ncbi:MAG: tetratricopeptide repeat protein [Bacteroidetes bacterium]|nr:tetratricopeptide repeat protein [Bacteroidota bacterium]
MAWVHAKGNFPEAIAHFNKALSLSLKVNGTFYIAKSYSGLCESYAAMGNYPEALKNGFASLKLFEQINDKSNQSSLHSALAFIYLKQRNYKASMKENLESLRLCEEIGYNYGIASSKTSIGELYYIQGNFDLAVEEYKKALITYEEIGEKYSIAGTYEFIGNSLTKKAEIEMKDPSKGGSNQLFKEALENYFSGLHLYEETDFKLGRVTSLFAIGNLYLLINDSKNAKIYLDKSLELSQSIKDKDGIKNAYSGLSEYYKFTGDFRKAFESYQFYIVYRDSLINEENTIQTVQTSMQYEFDKKTTAEKAAQEKKDAIALQEKIRQRNIKNSILVGLLGLLAFSIVVFIQRNKISKEKKRSENLLLNILPAETAEELKNTGESKAKKFESVSVLFTDFKNFTQASELMAPEDLVKEINYCFSEFDRIVTKYGIEKIKTIGDAYMCAGGIPVVNSTHAFDVVLAALEMQDFIIKNKEVRQAEGNPFFELRLGIHSGPVVAGIVGIKKFAYDIWGDTVNTASRMESSGEPGKVNISGVTYELIKDKFLCTYRGKIPAKNKGDIDMYFVDSRTSQG